MNNEREMKDVLREGRPWTMSNCQAEAICVIKSLSQTDPDEDAFEERALSRARARSKHPLIRSLPFLL